MQPGRQASPKVCQKRAPRPPLAPPKTLQEFLGGQGDWFSSWGFGTLELPERAPRLGKTRISAVSAMSGMAWPNRGLKDMTSMSGLRQELPQDLFNTPGAHGARRIEPAEPEPPPAHSIGKVGEDAMGGSGQFVKPGWLGAGGVALVGRNWWRGWWSGLFFRCFL